MDFEDTIFCLEEKKTLYELIFKAIVLSKFKRCPTQTSVERKSSFTTYLRQATHFLLILYMENRMSKHMSSTNTETGTS